MFGTLQLWAYSLKNTDTVYLIERYVDICINKILISLHTVPCVYRCTRFCVGLITQDSLYAVAYILHVDL